MGKIGEEEFLPISNNGTQITDPSAENRCRVSGLIRPRCIFAVVLGISVLLSAVFWLPPFFPYRDQGDLDLDSHQFAGHEIVASFMVDKPVSFLEDNILWLEDDIFDEIGVPTTKVKVIAIGTLAGSNITKVVFAVDPDEKGTIMSSAAKSLIRSSFVSLIIRQSSLRLTASLVGDPFSFEVLKFIGGITVIPPQSAFPLQQVQILFNFTLNFSIDQIQDDFDELTRQLKSGLHLSPRENLYITLTNSKGSTMAPPTTVQSSVLQAVGTPSKARLKQLAQTITGSHTENLGLNNTEFGRVKQVSLSSILQHSLNGGNEGGTSSSSPAPLPHPRRNHHHHHDHDHGFSLPPSMPPTPASEKGGSKDSPVLPPVLPPAHTPAPGKSHKEKPPDCHFGSRKRFPRRASKLPHLVPPAASPFSPSYTALPPQLQLHAPAPVPHSIRASSPLPNAGFVHTQPPSKSQFDVEPPYVAPSVSPSLSSSCSGAIASHLWAIMFLVLAFHL